MALEITIQLDLGRIDSEMEDLHPRILPDLNQLVEPLGGRIRPLHPGSTDPTLAAWLILEAADPNTRDRLLARLRNHELVQAAFVKPAAEPP